MVMRWLKWPQLGKKKKHLIRYSTAKVSKSVTDLTKTQFKISFLQYFCQRSCVSTSVGTVLYVLDSVPETLFSLVFVTVVNGFTCTCVCMRQGENFP